MKAGDRLADKLELVQPIGEGGMGAVWRARNVKIGAEVAIKVLRPERVGPDVSARFRYEARLGATLEHRNITRVFDLIEEEDGSLVLVMELLTGETLKSYASRVGRVPAREAVAITVSILAALQHAHDRGVVHRDLKPSNVFLHVDSDGYMTPKLLDFGIAKAAESSVDTRTGEVLGTPSYMSPEQVRGHDLDGRSDLFSAGIVLYELLSGASPYTGTAPNAVLAQVLEIEIDPDPHIDSRIWLEIQRALSKQAYARHATAKELSAALAGAVGETEAGLVRSLVRDVAELPRLEVFSTAGIDAPSTRDAPSSVVPLPARPARGLYALIAGMGAVSLLVTAGLVVTRRPHARPRSAAAPIASPPALSPSSTTLVAPAPSAADAPPVESLASSVSAHAPPPRVRPAVARPATSKPLARTPGF